MGGRLPWTWYATSLSCRNGSELVVAGAAPASPLRRTAPDNRLKEPAHQVGVGDDPPLIQHGDRKIRAARSAAHLVMRLHPAAQPEIAVAYGVPVARMSTAQLYQLSG